MKIFLILLMTILPTKAFADWLLIYEDQKKEIFMDLENLRFYKDKVRLWLLEDYKEMQYIKKIQYFSVKSFNEFDCGIKKKRILAYSLYEKKMAKGKVIFSKGRPFKWSKVEPSTINSVYMNLGCDELEANKQSP